MDDAVGRARAAWVHRRLTAVHVLMVFLACSAEGVAEPELQDSVP